MRNLLYPALFLAIECVYAADPPPMKEGLWSIHIVTTDQPGNKKTEGTRSICRNHAYDERVRAMAAKSGASCKTLSEHSSGGTMTTETQCSAGGSVLKTKGVVTMSGDGAAHSETNTTYTPALYGTSETTMIMDQKFMGACPAGMEPGDTMDANGKIGHRAQTSK